MSLVGGFKYLVPQDVGWLVDELIVFMGVITTNQIWLSRVFIHLADQRCTIIVVIALPSPMLA